MRRFLLGLAIGFSITIAFAKPLPKNNQDCVVVTRTVSRTEFESLVERVRQLELASKYVPVDPITSLQPETTIQLHKNKPEPIPNWVHAPLSINE